ncbi:MAG: hypothetical protein IJ001_05810 [Oscillospiraceae bacterium]|nr:hypothetical protein [Oscillospiraceae bacterium]
MYTQSDNLTDANSAPSRKETLHQKIAQLFCTPLFLGLIACYSATQVISLFTLSDRNPMAYLLSILKSWGINDYLITGPLSQLSNTIQSVQLFLLVPCIVVAIALWIIALNAKKYGEKRLYNIGFTTIQVIKFNQMIIMGIALVLVAIKGYSLLNELKELLILVSLQDAEKWIGIAKVMLVVGAIGTIYFTFRVLLTFSLMKESACETVSIQQTSLFVPIVCFILSAVSLLIQIKFGFDLVSLLNCGSAILFGVYLLNYRKVMDQLEQLG